MKIYIAHSSEIDYKRDLYEPIINDSYFKKHYLILPHESSNTITNTRADYKSIDILIAECSKASVGLGIELRFCI